jgi:hypothetical protein
MGERLYIVDYDIPAEPVRRRVQFHRDLNQILEKCGTPPEYSTRSVFRTPHMMLAEALFILVLAYGGSGHVYCGEEITGNLAVKDTSWK